ncbi:MAG: molybdenum cofactor biosynthesis protein MoaE [Acidobacteria bacterium]|nr:molybdenum cofactor biosynthesis protein MoaE [Acidobacteriota bacterium]
MLADPVRPSAPVVGAEDPPVPDPADLFDDHTWCGLRARHLPVAEVESWVRRPSSGAIVTFVGTARDHSEGRSGVVELVYEAYERYAVRQMQRVVERARATWPTVARVAVLHRTGAVAVGEDAVVVAVSSPHRDEAFPAAAFVIEAVKATAPIWKLERWADGESWSPNCRCADHGTLSEFGLVV